MANTFDVTAASVLAVAIGVRTVSTLVEKGVLTNDDALALYGGALQNIQDAAQRQEAQQILTTLMPGLSIG